MSDFLIKLFVTKGKDDNSPALRKKYGVFSSIVGVTLNVILAAFKLIVGLLSSSIAIIADAVNNLSDAGSSIVSFISFKIAEKPADRDHPFGHARIEYICSMIVSFLILLVGSELMLESVKGLFSNEESKAAFDIFTMIVLGASVLAKLWLSLFYRKISKRINSSVIKASSVDSFSDAISTFAVLVCAIIVKFTGFTLLDSIVGILISVMIFVAGIGILNETKNSLLGEAPVKELVENINEAVSHFPEVLGVHDMLVHNYGPNHYIASFHAEVDGRQDIFYLHDVIDNVERKINEELGILCTIHLDPIETDNETLNKLKETVSGVVAELSSNATIHDFRAVIGVTHTNLIFDVALPFEYKGSAAAFEEEMKTKMKELLPECYCVITVDRC